MLKSTNESGPTALAQRLRPFVRETPLLMTSASDFGFSGHPIVLKLELLQYSGNIKVRAAEAFCQRLAADVSKVVSACAPGDAIALAYVARRRGLLCRIHVATTTPFAEVARMRRSHPDLIFDTRADALRRRSAKVWAHRHGATYYDPEREDISLQAMATLGLELEAQLNDAHLEIDTLLVPVATGTTLAGLVQWTQCRGKLSPLKLVGVETQRAPAFYYSKRVGAVCKVEVSGITVGAPSTRRLSPLVFQTANQAVSEAVLVADADIVEAQYTLWSQLGLAAGTRGALGLAALTSGAYVPQMSERIGVVISSAHLGPIDWDHSR